jgi:hypothetical protein
MLRRAEGATLAQLTAALGWQGHTVRAVISVSLRKARRLTVQGRKSESGEWVYRIVA